MRLGNKTDDEFLIKLNEKNSQIQNIFHENIEEIVKKYSIDVDYVKDLGYSNSKGVDWKTNARYKLALAGASGGKGGSQVICDQNFVSNGILGSTIALATGIAFGIKRDGKKNCVLCFMGDGALGPGIAYESFNISSSSVLGIIILLNVVLLSRS